MGGGDKVIIPEHDPRDCHGFFGKGKRQRRSQVLERTYGADKSKPSVLASR